MIIEGLIYVVWGWILLAAVPALGYALHWTVMLPSTTAILMCHVAFVRTGSLTRGMLLALILGYLEDVHQGAPTGLLMFCHGVAFAGIYWVSARVSVHGLGGQILVSTLCVIVIDVTTWALLLGVADPLGLRIDAIHRSLWEARWHIVATALMAQPLWLVTNRMFSMVRIDRLMSGRGAKMSELLNG